MQAPPRTVEPPSGGGVRSAYERLTPTGKKVTIAVGCVAVIVLAWWYKDYRDAKNTASSTTSNNTSTDSTAATDEEDQVPNDAFSDFDPWQYYGQANAKTSPYEGEKIGSGFYTRGANTPAGYTFLTPQKLHAYKGPYYYEPKSGTMRRMGNTQLKAETPLYGDSQDVGVNPGGTIKKTVPVKRKTTKPNVNPGGTIKKVTKPKVKAKGKPTKTKK